MPGGWMKSPPPGASKSCLAAAASTSKVGHVFVRRVLMTAGKIWEGHLREAVCYDSFPAS